MANARLARLDYYALLQVARDAPADDVRRAFHRFAVRYHPDRFVAQGAAPERVARAGEIYRRGAEAYRVLCDPQQRKLYDAGLQDGRLRFDPQAEPPASVQRSASWPVKVRNPAARPFARKAERAYEAGDWASCRLNLKLALNKDRGHPQLEALLQAVEGKLAGG